MISRCTHRHAPNEGKEKKCKPFTRKLNLSFPYHCKPARNTCQNSTNVCNFLWIWQYINHSKACPVELPSFFFCTNDKQIIKKTHRQKDREENKQTKKQILSTRCFLLALCALITLEPLRFNRVQNSKACINVRWCLASVLGTSSLMRLEPKSGYAGRPSLHTRLQSNWI